ncbi:MAG: Holliday junction branch migration protein RuvA [Nitrospirota bacterium]
MIASLSGKLRRKGTDYLVVDVSGVGYQVSVPLSTYCGIPEQGDNVSLHIHTHLREDSLSLFGFLTEAEKDMFLLLMGVSGIGPKLALAVLSSLSVADLSCAIGASDDAKLCAVPGIGKKTAARMVLELKDKMAHLLPSMIMSSTVSAPGPDIAQDVISALVGLGYKKPQAEETVRRIRDRRPGLPIEALIREALSDLMKR